MIEFAPSGTSGLYRQGVAGDTVNTAVYLRRLGMPVRYLTAVGDDAFSEQILYFLQIEGIETHSIRRCDSRRPGLYVILNDANGERKFSYWRNESPVRQLFDTPVALDDVDVFYFSGITLAVCRSGLSQLLQLLYALQGRGCRIVFDPNFRPVLWDTLEQAREHYRAVLPFCDTVLPTLEDDLLLWESSSVDDSRSIYAETGVGTILIKAPDLTVYGFTKSESVKVPANTVRAIDTTGAGDAFAAGYLAAHLQQRSLRDAILEGQTLAARVVQHRGAIIPAASMPSRG
jgi:2-dehydro-3-deoxygluconokinase